MKLEVNCLALVFLCLLSCDSADRLGVGREVSMSEPLGPEDSHTPLSEGGEILMKSQRAYHAIESYSGTIELSLASGYPQNVHRESRLYNVYFKAPDRLRFDGHDSNGDPEWIVGNGKTFREDPHSASVGGVHNLREALWAHGGVSLRASVLLPGLLLGIEWTTKELWVLPGGPLLRSFARDAVLKGNVAVDECECYEVECAGDMETWIFAVDKHSYLIRQIKSTASPEQMRVQRERGGGGFSGHIQWVENTQTFHIDSINQELDPALFKVD